MQWIESARKFLKPSVLIMLFFGFSAGIPILLIFSSLSLWLREAGVERSAVTFFSWAALGYSFKFIWAPLVDRLPLPLLHNLLGRRRSWILFSQIFIVIGILGMALTNPADSDAALKLMAFFAVLLGFSSATQDIAIDAFRIESDTVEMQALLSSTYIAGYRVGMIVAGAGALVLASTFGSTPENYNYGAWRLTYIIMSLSMLIGIVTTFVASEPEVRKVSISNYTNLDYAKFTSLFLIIAASFAFAFFSSSELLSQATKPLVNLIGATFTGFITETVRFALAVIAAILASWILVKIQFVNRKMVNETYVEPVREFFQRYGSSVAILLLALVGLYRISDIVLGVISNVFYQDLGFTKEQIAAVVKTYGLLMSLLGGFLGGILTLRLGVIRILFWGAVISAATNLLFMALAQMGDNILMLYVVISADNLAAGMASAAFVAFLSSLTNVSFTAVQYAIFTSLMTLFPKLLGGYSGTLVDSIGYPGFFAFTALLGVPVLFLVHIAGKRLSLKAPAVE